jgi:hypothetical protein
MEWSSWRREEEGIMVFYLVHGPIHVYEWKGILLFHMCPSKASVVPGATRTHYPGYNVRLRRARKVPRKSKRARGYSSNTDGA